MTIQEYHLCWLSRSQPRILHACIHEKVGVWVASAPHRSSGLTVDMVQILQDSTEVSTSEWAEIQVSVWYTSHRTCLLTLIFHFC